MSLWKRLHIFFSDHFCFIKPPEEEKSWGNGLSSCFSLFSVPRSDLLLGFPVRTGNMLIKSKSCSFSTFHSYQMSSRCPETRMLQKKKGSLANRSPPLAQQVEGEHIHTYIPPQRKICSNAWWSSSLIILRTWIRPPPTAPLERNFYQGATNGCCKKKWISEIHKGVEGPGHPCRMLQMMRMTEDKCRLLAREWDIRQARRVLLLQSANYVAGRREQMARKNLDWHVKECLLFVCFFRRDRFSKNGLWLGSTSRFPVSGEKKTWKVFMSGFFFKANFSSFLEQTGSELALIKTLRSP